MIWDSFQGKSKKEREEPKILYILTAPLRHLFAYKSHRALNVHPPSLSELNRKNNTDLSHLQPESRNVNFTAVQVTKISRPRVTPLAHNSLLLIINSRQGERCTGVSESLPSTPQQMDFQGEKSGADNTFQPREVCLYAFLFPWMQKFHTQMHKEECWFKLQRFQATGMEREMSLNRRVSLWIFQGPTSLTLRRDATGCSMKIIWLFPPVHLK